VLERRGFRYGVVSDTNDSSVSFRPAKRRRPPTTSTTRAARTVGGWGRFAHMLSGAPPPPPATGGSLSLALSATLTEIFARSKRGPSLCMSERPRVVLLLLKLRL